MNDSDKKGINPQETFKDEDVISFGGFVDSLNSGMERAERNDEEEWNLENKK